MNNQTNNDFFTIFIFPFKYEKSKEGEKLTPKFAAKKLEGENKSSESGWVQSHFSLDSKNNYNEFHYFHPYVRKVIFNKDNKNKGMEYLVRKDFKKLKVEFSNKDNEIQSITTDVKSIDIHLYDNQIGLLSITTEKMENDHETDYDDFLKYNDIARRVYPPYLGDNNTCSLKLDTKILPTKIVLYKDNEDKDLISESFDPINLDKSNQGEDVLFLSEIINKLLDPFILLDISSKIKIEDRIYYTPYIDDRMFVVSYYANEEISNQLKYKYPHKYDFETSDDWYSYIFVDGNGSNICNEDMKTELINDHTYKRWIDSGTFFGMSRYSLVVLCNDSPFSRIILKQHMKSIYYQMALIVLFQRMMLIKFAEDVDKVTEEIYNSQKEEITLEKLQPKSSELQANFIEFINKYWFIEITPQEQGIEIYEQWKELLKLEKLYDSVKNEISELAEYVENKIESNTNLMINTITVWGFPIAIIGAFISIIWDFSEKIIKLLFCESFVINSLLTFIGNLFITVILSFLLFFVLKEFIEEKLLKLLKNKKLKP